MSFFSFQFLIFLCALVLLFGWHRSGRYRRILLTAANVIFLLTLVADLRTCLAFLAFALISYGMLAALRARPSRGALAAFIVLVVCALIYIKQYQFLAILLPAGTLHHGIVLVGISYMTFKLIHMLVDLFEGQLPAFTLASYVNYQLGFFSVVAGPIQRYPAFHEFWLNIEGDPAGGQNGVRNWNRVLSGLIKLGVVAEIAIWVYEDCYQRLSGSAGSVETAVLFLGLFYAYPLFVYFNFSGYCDIVIGAAGLLGMKQQENFDRPFRARNLIDFWNRWHISLTMWIRDYVFMTSYKWVAERWISAAPKVGYVLLFMALFLAGVWHGSTNNFLVFGVIHGVGVAANQLYADALKRRLGAAGVKRYLANPWIRRASITVTLHYVCFAFLFFTPGVGKTIGLLKTVGARVFG